MSGPWEDYAPKAAVGRPWDDYKPAKPKKSVNPFADAVGSYLGGLGDSVAGFADMVLSATPAGTALSTVRTAADMADGFQRTHDGQVGPRVVRSGNVSTTSDFVTPRTYKPQTKVGRGARSLGQNTLNAAIPGSTAARIANVLVPTATGETFALGAEGMGASEKVQDNARTAGNVVGGFAASLRGNPFAPRDATALDQFASRTRANPDEMRANAERLRAAGVEPTLTDVSGEPGRRVIRAVGVRSEQGGEALTQRAAQTSATAKPAVMDRARGLGPFPGQTASEVEAAAIAERDAVANRDYRPLYQRPVPVTEDTARALVDEPGKAALRRARRAAVARMDEQQVAEIDRLLATEPVPQNPFEWYRPAPDQVSAATLDRTRIALREGADRAAQNRSRDLAGGLRSRVGMIDSSLDAVPELGPARQAFRERSQAVEMFGRDRADPFTTDPADYARWLQNLSPQARATNQVALRQDILDTLGGQRSGTYGTLDQLATSPYAQQNLRAAFGEQADAFLANIRARLEQTRNASFVQPNAGSRTQVLANDVGNTAQNVVGGFRQAVTGDVWGLAERAVDAWRSRGINPQQAEELARIAVDPNQTDAAIQAIANRLDPATRHQFLSLRNALPVAAIAANRPPTPSAPQ